MKKNNTERRFFISKSMTFGSGVLLGGTVVASTAMNKDFFRFPDDSMQVTAMPDPSGHENKVLSLVGGKAEWKEQFFPNPYGKKDKILASDGANSIWKNKSSGAEFVLVGDVLNITS